MVRQPLLRLAFQIHPDKYQNCHRRKCSNQCPGPWQMLGHFRNNYDQSSCYQILGGEKGKKFKMANFKKLLLSIQDKTMNEQKTILETTMAEWKGDTEQVDDILVMGVRF